MVRPQPARWVFAALLLVLVVFGAATPSIVHGFESASTIARITVSVATLLPIGFLMGMAFPLGMRRALAETPSIAPWLWGVNGAASVCASVLVVVIALGAGISAAFWAGTVCYALAGGTLIADSSRPVVR
jgi:peptidoglycan/LPS O-acetylase OafA/YrhL